MTVDTLVIVSMELRNTNCDNTPANNDNDRVGVRKERKWKWKEGCGMVND